MPEEMFDAMMKAHHYETADCECSSCTDAKEIATLKDTIYTLEQVIKGQQILIDLLKICVKIVPVTDNKQ